jgi:cytochrome c553
MNKLIKTAFITLGLVVAAQGASAAGDAAAGEAKTAMCSACHGKDGNSAAAAFPKLAGLGEKYLYKQMREIKSGQRKVVEMTGMLAALSDEDMQNVAAYYAAQTTQLSGAKDIKVQLQSGLNSEDPIALGAKVYRSGNAESGIPACSGCHSPRGLGNAPAGYPRISGQHADYLAKQLKAFRNGDRTNDGDNRIMRQVAQYMTDAEIQSVSNFIAGLN